MPDTPRLPSDAELDIEKLSRTLSDAHITSSYKFLWLLALLRLLPKPLAVSARAPRHAPLRVPFRELVWEMLRIADDPARRFRLSFGAGDRIKQKIDAIAPNETVLALANTAPANRQGQKFTDACAYLERFVPQQWLVPFFDGEETLPQRSDARAARVLELAAKGSKYDKPLPYRFVEERRGSDIEMHPRWLAYFVRNRDAVESWARHRWVRFLQKKNPHTPGIANKIMRVEARARLAQESAWWRTMLERMGRIEPVKCIYSGAHLTPDSEFELDHYVPWNFIGHDRLWNLVPATKDANLMKGDRLPAEKYFRRFVALQHRALNAYARFDERRAKPGWHSMTAAYVNDLRLHSQPRPGAPVPNSEQLEAAYDLVVQPLIARAKQHGFKPWKY